METRVVQQDMRVFRITFMLLCCGLKKQGKWRDRSVYFLRIYWKLWSLNIPSIILIEEREREIMSSMSWVFWGLNGKFLHRLVLIRQSHGVETDKNIDCFPENPPTLPHGNIIQGFERCRSQCCWAPIGKALTSSERSKITPSVAIADILLTTTSF